MGLRNLLSVVLLLATAQCTFAQVGIGIKVGTNYVIGSMKIQPDPKEPPTNPKGLGLSFGGYAEIPFSDMVGLRPELTFSFRRMLTEQTVTVEHNNVQAVIDNQQGTFTGKEVQTTETDQRLNYFQINAPIMISPSSGFRVMAGPAFGILMGGKRNTDTNYEIDGTFTVNGQNTTINPDPTFTTEEKKGSAAIRDFRKMEVMALLGVGYTLPIGFDMDLRYYRGIVTNYDESEGSSRFRVWTNMIEFALGWTFGGPSVE